jgi:hypothetical protein
MRLAVSMAGLLGAAALGGTCARSGAPPLAAPARTASVPVPAAAPPSLPAPDAFKREVAPVLARTCAPCHNPGGSMYAKLPFDDAATVRGHGDAVLRRLKGDDRAAVARWLDAP